MVDDPRELVEALREHGKGKTISDTEPGQDIYRDCLAAAEFIEAMLNGFDELAEYIGAELDELDVSPEDIDEEAPEFLKQGVDELRRFTFRQLSDDLFWDRFPRHTVVVRLPADWDRRCEGFYQTLRAIDDSMRVSAGDLVMIRCEDYKAARDAYEHFSGYMNLDFVQHID